jgi:ABC-type multidrug transport system ATPase subunit
MEGVLKCFGRRKALDGLDLRVPAGSLCGLVGSNGAGKTTSMSVAVGLLHARRGRVNLLGDGPFDPERHAGRVSLLPQDTQLPRHSRVLELLVYYAELQGMPPRTARERAVEVIEWVHLSDRVTSPVRTLSHGMKRRVMIAQAFLGSPELILLDEPLSGLDPREVANIRDLLRGQRGARTVVVSSHNLHEIERICDHVVFIEGGRTVKQDTMAAVTGRHHVLTCLLGAGTVPLDALRQAVPGAALERLDGSDAGAQTLICRFGPSDGTPAEVNGRLLRALLDSGTEILEVRQGEHLEGAYLQGSAAAPRSAGQA